MKTPDHYTSTATPIERLPEVYKEGFIIGNIIKYASRAGLKDSFEQDLEKCLHYCQMLMELRADKVKPEPKGEVPPLPEGAVVPDGGYQLGLEDVLNEETDWLLTGGHKWQQVRISHGDTLGEKLYPYAYRKL